MAKTTHNDCFDAMLDYIAADTYLYRINTASSELHRNISAALAEGIVQSGEKLYRLLPERRDLETLFREVNEDSYQQEAMSHAA